MTKAKKRNETKSNAAVLDALWELQRDLFCVWAFPQFYFFCFLFSRSKLLPTSTYTQSLVFSPSPNRDSFRSTHFAPGRNKVLLFDPSTDQIIHLDETRESFWLRMVVLLMQARGGWTGPGDEKQTS